MLVISFLFSFCACSVNSTAVPEQLIKNDVNEKFGDADFYYSTTHNMDKSTYIDTVTVEVVVTRKYYQEYIVGTCKYRYDKSNDTWDNYGDPKWESDRVEYLAHKYSGKWEGSFKNGGTYLVDISSVDFEKREVTGSFSATKTSISLGGSKHTYELDASGTYNVSEENDGYELEITQSGYTFVFKLSKYYGVQGVTIYNARTGYAV